MSKPFSVLGSLVLLLLGIAQGVWLWKAVNVTVGDLSMPIWVPIGGLAIALLTSFGIAFEAMRGARARQAQLPVPADDAVSRDIQRKPSKFTVKQGRRYKARIELGFFEQVASNSMIADKFQEVGFSDVSVTGDGSEREAIGRWTRPDTAAQLPSQVVAAVEIVEPTVTASLTAAATSLAQQKLPSEVVPAPAVPAVEIVESAAASAPPTAPTRRN